MFVLLIGIAVLYTINRRVALGEDFCPTERPPTAYVAILIDVTDRYTEEQKKVVRKVVASTRDSVPTNGKMLVYALKHESTRTMSPLVALCNPGSGKGVSGLTQNPKQMRKQWETKFQAPVDALLKGLLQEPESRRSPIMAAIYGLVVDTFDGLPADMPRKLVVVSDMLENTNAYTQYGLEQHDFEAFRGTEAYTRVGINMSGIEVWIYYLRRDRRQGGSVQKGRGHIRFWEKFFDAQGAKVMKVRSIAQGGMNG